MTEPSARPRLGVVGSCNVDHVVRCRELPRPGETVLGDDVLRLPGGKGANQAAAASRLGADVSLIAALGTDESATWLLDALREHGVREEFIFRSPRPTGAAFIAVDDAGENEIVVSSGANADLDLSRVEFDLFDVVLGQLEVRESVIADAAARSRRFVLNAAPAASVRRETLARCSVVIVNEVESELIDVASLEHCVLTLGARGAVHYRFGREVVRASALDVEPVDTVGAGDVFCAAYAVQCAMGASALDALRFAAVAGSLATLAVGAQGALPTREEVEAWLERA